MNFSLQAGSSHSIVVALTLAHAATQPNCSFGGSRRDQVKAPRTTVTGRCAPHDRTSVTPFRPILRNRIERPPHHLRPPCRRPIMVVSLFPVLRVTTRVTISRHNIDVCTLLIRRRPKISGRSIETGVV